MSRRVVVVDTETTSLTVSRAAITEVAAVDVETGDVLCAFVPHLPREAWAKADLESLAINGYLERRTFELALGVQETEQKYVELWDLLDGAVLAGSNPAYDATVLGRAFDGYDLPPAPWHYRLLDISAYAAGVLGRELGDAPGLQAVLDQLGIVNPEPHSARGDALATAAAFRALRGRL